METVGWIAWFALLLLAIVFTIPVSQGALRSFGHTVIMWWALLLWTLFTPFPKYNILWLAPILAFLPTLVLFLFALHTDGLQRSPGTHVWLALLLLSLALLTYWPFFRFATFPQVWATGAILASLIIIARHLTNGFLRREGRCPRWVSSLYLAGFLGLIAAALWFPVTLGWRTAVPVAFCYFVTKLVPSVIVAAVGAGT